MRTSRLLRTMLCWALALCLIAGNIALPAFAESEDSTFNYVSIGASNTNGYGMRGYITEEELELMLSGQVSKDEVNVYGYQRTPEGAYPDLIRDYYEEIYETVNVNQLAISSMRVEELRVLLDNSYMGDDYTSWRFTGSDGWFISAEPGGLEALRTAYQESIAEADLITVDIGWNNFGVYVCNQLVDYLSNGRFKWTTDVTTIFDTDEEDQAALEAKAIIGQYIQSYVEDPVVSGALTDIFAYSILGYIHNFDICMDKIYELNPDANVVVLGIQNLLHGVAISIGETELPLGDIFGNFVNMANYYSSACSPYQADFQYVKAGTNEHVTIFLDYMTTYDGNVEELDQNVKDCFDYYDNDLFIQTRIDYMAAAMIEEMLKSELGEDNISLALTVLGCSDFNEVVILGKQGGLPTLGDTDYQVVFDSMYWPALNAAYDTLAQLVKEVALMSSVEVSELLGGTLDIGQVEDALISSVENEITENALAAAQGEAYTVDTDLLLPDTSTSVVAAMYIRYYMGNSFFAHPNGEGHSEIADAVTNIINYPETEKDQALADYLIESVHRIQKLLNEATNVTVAVTGVALDKTSAELFVGESLTLTATIAPADATNKDVIWATTDDKVATVDANGKVTAVGTGSAFITVITADGSFTAQCSIVVSTKAVENPFTDVKSGDYFYDPVMWALSKNITTGMDATHFDPSRNCTRGQVVTFLWRAAGCPEPTTTENPFKDVKASDYFYKAVLWAVENNITAGMGNGTFAPNATCTRGQVVTFLWRAAGTPEAADAKNDFTDVQPSAYYADAVLWAVENGITTGMGNNTFAPNASCTRGQIVTFLYRTFA